MKIQNQPLPSIECFQKEDGLFLARCDVLGLRAEGATFQEAESVLFQLIEDRTTVRGELSSPTVVISDPDVLSEPVE